jgi:peptidoglycan/LPS O-acetylase OafA/YrhL
MRKNYIDNLRSSAILLLIPYHTFMMYNNWGEGQFVTGQPAEIPSFLIRMIAPWFMPLLFMLAGISSFYAITNPKNGSNRFGRYIKERFLRLLLPFLTGMSFYVPLMPFIADSVHNGYNEGYFEHYKIFFTRITDFSGADGGFTPAHLWFLLFLFVISLISLAIIIPKSKYSERFSQDSSFFKRKYAIIVLILFGAIPILTENVINIAGKSVTFFLAVYLLGYYVFSKDNVIAELFKFRFLLLILMFISCIALGIGIFHFDSLFIDIIGGFFGWMFILTALAFGSRYFNSTGKMCLFLRKYSFVIYQIHYPILVVIAYFLQTESTGNIGLNLIPLLIFATYVITILLAYIIGNIPIVKVLFGQK